jgi:hypothetical protein
LHTYVVHPLLINFRAINDHNLECFETGQFEDRYAVDNFLNCNGIHVIRDSDEYAHLALTPAQIGYRDAPAGDNQWRSFRNFTDRCRIRASMLCHGSEGHLGRQISQSPIRWHAEDLDEDWDREERIINDNIRVAIGDYLASEGRINLAEFSAMKWFRFLPVFVATRYGLAPYIGRLGAISGSYFSVLLRALMGDPIECKRIAARIRIFSRRGQHIRH